MSFKTLLIPALLSLLLLPHSTASAETYQYDEQGRLVGVTYDDGSSISYELDEVGNPTGRTAAAGTAQPPDSNPDQTPDTTTEPDVDEDGGDGDGGCGCITVRKSNNTPPLRHLVGLGLFALGWSIIRQRRKH